MRRLLVLLTLVLLRGLLVLLFLITLRRLVLLRGLLVHRLPQGRVAPWAVGGVVRYVIQSTIIASQARSSVL